MCNIKIQSACLAVELASDPGVMFYITGSTIEECYAELQKWVQDDKSLEILDTLEGYMSDAGDFILYLDATEEMFT